MLNNIMSFVKNNLWLSLIGGFLMLFVFFGKQMKKMFGSSPRRRRRPVRRATVTRRRSVARVRSRRPLPRSVGVNRRRSSRTGYPAAGGGSIPYKYNKDGSIKKAWQVSGTVAARRRMAGLRKKR